MRQTLYEKLYNSHIVKELYNNIQLIYVDRHLLHEVTSPQAFYSLIKKNRIVRKPNKTFATMDHNVSTCDRNIFSSSKLSVKQMQKLIENCKKFHIKLYDLQHPLQGIIHVIAPEQAITLPGMVIVCGDSHTCTHGAFGALSFGIGTSEVEHVLCTQTIEQNRFKNMNIKISGKISKYISAKDIILAVIRETGVSGGNGYVVEFTGNVISNLDMEGRMTICNMAIEMGAKTGLIAPDEKTFLYLKNKKYSPKYENWDKAINFWRTLKSDKNAYFDKKYFLNINNLSPQITWGINPGQSISIDQKIPSPNFFFNISDKNCAQRALDYMDLKPGQYLTDIKVDKVFIGSCTNSRIEDLRSAASIINNNKIASHVKAIVVPGSYQVKMQAERENLDKIFINAGFEWRFSGCSMCLAMNDDKLNINERCASTSNRNFENRQGYGGKTHLMSPKMAAAAAIAGHFVDIRKI